MEEREDVDWGLGRLRAELFFLNLFPLSLSPLNLHLSPRFWSIFSHSPSPLFFSDSLSPIFFSLTFLIYLLSLSLSLLSYSLSTSHFVISSYRQNEVEKHYRWRIDLTPEIEKRVRQIFCVCVCLLLFLSVCVCLPSPPSPVPSS